MRKITMGFRGWIRNPTPLLAGLALTAFAANYASAQDAACPLPGQKPSLVVQLFFGQSIKNRGPVTRKEWDAFLLQTVTPRFPDGFTVYDSYGQWRDTATHKVTREKSKVIFIITEQTDQIRASIEEVSDAYRKRFRQQSVAVVTNPGCSAF
jgi:hypothetical protein